MKRVIEDSKLQWRECFYFRWSSVSKNYWVDYLETSTRIPYGLRSFTIAIKRDGLIGKNYQVSTSTVEGPKDFRTYSFVEEIGTFPTLKKAIEECEWWIGYDHHVREFSRKLAQERAMEATNNA